MKKFRILMGALVLAMVAIVIIACTKEKETMVAQSRINSLCTYNAG